MGSNEMHCTMHALSAPTRRKAKTASIIHGTIPGGEGQGRLWTHCVRTVSGDSPQIAKTAGCRLRFMLEEKRKGKMKN